MAQAYLTKTLFKYLSRHLPKEALAGDKESWTPDIMTQAISLITNGYKLFSTIHRHLMRLKAFIDSLETDQVDGAQGTRIDQKPIIDALMLNDVLNDAHRALIKNKNKNNMKSLDI